MERNFNLCPRLKTEREKERERKKEEEKLHSGVSTTTITYKARATGLIRHATINTASSRAVGRSVYRSVGQSASGFCAGDARRAMPLPLNGVDQRAATPRANMGSLEMMEILAKKDDLIKDLERKLKVKEDEITDLRSQLDKFQSIIPYSAASSTSKVPPRKTRAQGISAEPQAVKTIQELSELSQTTFPEVPKSLR